MADTSSQDPWQTVGQEPLLANQSSLRLLSWTLLGSVAPIVLVMLIAVMTQPIESRNWMALVVPFCGGLVGLVFGFLYATVGRETTKFGPAMTAVGSALGGAGAVELARPDGTVRVFFVGLAKSAGMPEQPVLVSLVFIGFAAAGFLWMYLLKTLLLNSAILQAQKEEDGYNEAVKRINSSTAQAAVDPTATTVVSADIIAAAKEITDAPKPMDVPSLRERGKAQFLQGHHADTQATMKEVLAQVPTDRTAVLYLASSLLEMDGQETEAIPYLNRLVEDPSAPAIARKLLGYALLFVGPDGDRRQALERSLQVTNEYLKLYPQDAGAWLNRACALAQLSDIDEAFLTQVWEAITDAVKVGGEPIRQSITSELSQPGLDFYKVSSRLEFRKALEAIEHNG